MRAELKTPSPEDGRPGIALLVPDMPSPKALMPWLQRMHEARHYSNFGPLVCELEKRLAARFVGHGRGRPAVTTVSSATTGLELVLQALDLPPGSRVLVPALTFVATATAVLRAGHVPVLCDVDADSWLLTPEIARRACADVEVRAVMPVAAFGAPHDARAWDAFSRATGLPVVIDAAAAFGGQWLHDTALTLVFSLHTTKSLPAGEGGLVVSHDDALVARVRQLSNFGINLQARRKVPVGALAEAGTNAKMSEFHAAVGLASLERWDERAALRRDTFARYAGVLEAAAPGRLRWQRLAGGEPVAAPVGMCLRLPGATARSRFEKLCHDDGVGTRRWYQPLLTQMTALQPLCEAMDCPQAQAIAQDLVGVPFFLGLSPADQDRVAALLSAALVDRRHAPRPEVRHGSALVS
ncbi:DegT/DnrJ/EryC1/StrS family aminotransferase [Xylophilus sp. GOD-11R]|uniref:DegT/DnrJ/EryC1/StrS family aminotransferase n=1 Tax=Xylophilus sp. GOD-11R TaxID=3089814 RepID=UPI00298D2974|nr:DegT/DnrJ/EryC1/StrS family aminotransferase [Xylophilus sp. GOD-11R]WPB57760.1 DegT/DnrJ/EryC1/StrS family aminotransferase [Xylophilus sp. GOD-11R]